MSSINSVNTIQYVERITGPAGNLYSQPDSIDVATFSGLLDGVERTKTDSSPAFGELSLRKTDGSAWDRACEGINKASETIQQFHAPVAQFVKSDDPMTVSGLLEMTYHSIQSNLVESFVGRKAESSGEEASKLYQSK